MESVELSEQEFRRRFLERFYDPVFDEVKEWEGKRDHVEIFALELSGRPQVRIDHREVVAAGWFSPERALELNLFPPIRKIIEDRVRAEGRGSA